MEIHQIHRKEPWVVLFQRIQFHGEFWLPWQKKSSRQKLRSRFENNLTQMVILIHQKIWQLGDRVYTSIGKT